MTDLICRKCGRDKFKNRFSFTAHLRFCGVPRKVKGSSVVVGAKISPPAVGTNGDMVSKLRAEAMALRQKATRLDEMAEELQAMG